jgi:hypothetical protein
LGNTTKILFSYYKQAEGVMSNQPTPGVFLEMAYNSNAFFQESRKGDVCFRTAQSNQSILFGTQKNQLPTFGIDGSNVFVRGDFDVLGSTKVRSNLYVSLHVSVGDSNFDTNYLVHVKSNIIDPEGVAVAIENSSSTGYSVLATRNGDTSTVNGGTRIGTTGTTYMTTNYYLSNAGFVETDTGNGLSIAANNTNGQIRFYTGGVDERLRIDSNGSIGINIITPTEKLDVVGHAKITSNL